MRRVVLLLACLGLLTACGTLGPTPTPSAQPSPTACEPSQIQLTAGRSGAAAGSMVLTFQARLVDGFPCLVLAWPGVEIVDGSATRIVAAAADAAAAPHLALLSSLLEFHLGWASACAPLPNGPYKANVGLLESDVVPLALPAGFGPSACMGGPMRVWVEPGWNY